MLFSLDISTSITGYTIIDELTESIVFCGFWDLKKLSSMFEKALFIEQELKKLKQEYNIKYIFIEPSLHMFTPGKSSANTISTLTKFNGIVSFLSYKTFDIEPQYIPAVSARKLYGIKVPRGTKAKKVVLDYVIEHEKYFIIEYTKQGNPKAHYYDMADALVIGRAGLTLLKQ